MQPQDPVADGQADPEMGSDFSLTLASKPKLTAVGLALSCSTVLASVEPEKWVALGGALDGRQIYVNQSSVKEISEHEVQAWVENRFPGRRPNGSGQPYTVSRYLVAFDCARKTVRVTDYIFFSKPEGKVVASGSAEPRTLVAINSDSFVETEKRYVCASVGR